MSTATAVQIGSAVPVGIGLRFGELGYIGKPMWAERSTLINIRKKIHPKWGEEKRKLAIMAELDKLGLAREDYERILQRAHRPFYTDTNADDGSGEIILPRHIVVASLIQTLRLAPRNAVPQIDRGLLHIGLQMTDGFLRTGKTLADAKERVYFVKMEESNERSYETAKYISDFIATGTLLVDETCFAVDDLEKLFEYDGRYIVIGSSRNQGYGRYVVNHWSR